MLKDKQYELIKNELLLQNVNHSVVNELAFSYVERIIKMESLINDIKNDNITPYPEGVRNEFIHEYSNELSAYEYCLFECIQIIELKKTLKDYCVELENSIDSYRYELYPGFLGSKESILEVSIMYSTLKRFKDEINTLLTCSKS